jgi:hypothetical protein
VFDGGDAELDDCGVCDGGNVDMDCAGICDGDAEYDCAGVCDGNTDEDVCGECGGDETDPNECATFDCFGDVDVCLDLNNSNLFYESSVDIAGFQFDHNGCVTGASGGDAEANGFSISFSDVTVLGFSFSGDVIPAGSGMLLELEGDVTPDCLSEIIFSDSDGMQLDVQLPGADVDPFVYVAISDTSDGAITIDYYSNSQVAGFEFRLLDSNDGLMFGDLAYGGLANEYLDAVSFSSASGMALGFSFTGATIPAGGGTLFQVENTKSSKLKYV